MIAPAPVDIRIRTVDAEVDSQAELEWILFADDGVSGDAVSDVEGNHIPVIGVGASDGGEGTPEFPLPDVADFPRKFHGSVWHAAVPLALVPISCLGWSVSRNHDKRRDEPNSIRRTARDDVARWVPVGAAGPPMSVFPPHSHRPVREGDRSRRVDADEVPLDEAPSGDSGAVVSRNDVALRRQRATDNTPDHTAGVAAASRDGARRVRADEAAFHCSPASERLLLLNRLMTSPRIVTAFGMLSEPDAVVTRGLAVDLDQQNGVVAREQRVRARARLGVAIDSHRVLDGRQLDVGVIVWTPAPGMAKAIRSVSALALASRIAWRSDPAPSRS